MATPTDIESAAPHDGIVAYGLGRRFGEITAAADVDIEVPPGTVTGLLGPNGAGKTTTLRMLATLLQPTAGTAHVGGFDIGSQPIEVKRHIGYLTGDTGLYGKLTPRELLRYFGRLHGIDKRCIERRIAHVIEVVGIESFQDRHCEKLSSGQKQRVSIGRAVLHDPPVLILDEPTSGLDILAARDILKFFRAEADRGKAVLLSTHIMAEVELICDRAAIIHRGRIRHAGSLTELAAISGASSLSAGFFELLGEGDDAEAREAGS